MNENGRDTKRERKKEKKGKKLPQNIDVKVFRFGL